MRKMITGTSYFEGRAEEELQLAEQAAHPAAVRAHYLLAGFYLDQVYGGATVSVSQMLDVTPTEAKEGGVGKAD
jgi:hypothetical protein